MVPVVRVTNVVVDIVGVLVVVKAEFWVAVTVPLVVVVTVTV